MKHIKTYQQFLNENLTLSQFNISQSILFMLKDRYNIDPSLQFLPVDDHIKAHIQENDDNLYFGYNENDSTYTIIFKTKIDKTSYKMVKWLNDDVMIDTVDNINNLYKNFKQKGIVWYYIKNPVIWIDENDSKSKLIKILFDFCQSISMKFPTYIERYKDHKEKTKIQEFIESKLKPEDIEDIKNKLETIENFNDDKKLFREFSKDKNLIYQLYNWLNDMQPEYQHEESIIILASILKDLLSKKQKEDMMKSFYLFMSKNKEMI